MEKIITFNNGDPELDFYSKLNWNAGEICSVCFYKNKPVSVQLIDVEDQNLENLLNNSKYHLLYSHSLSIFTQPVYILQPDYIHTV